MTRVSCIMPVWDDTAWLAEAIASLEAQTMPDWELLVVDDGSETADARRALDAIDQRGGPRTRLLRLPHGGVCRARNRAIAEARGEFLSFFDGDDRMRPRYLERMCEALDGDRGLAFASSWVHLFGDEEWDWRPERCDFPTLLGDCSVATAAVVRKGDVLAVGGFDERMELGHEDWDLWLGIVARGRRGRIVPEVLFDYRRRAGSRSTIADHGGTFLALYAERVRKHLGSYREHLFEALWEKEIAVGHLIYDLIDRQGQLAAAEAQADSQRAKIVNDLDHAQQVLAKARRELAALRARLGE
jgi:glycosyltransferase involved in cell wall biosynthesis